MKRRLSDGKSLINTHFGNLFTKEKRYINMYLLLLRVKINKHPRVYVMQKHSALQNQTNEECFRSEVNY